MASNIHPSLQPAPRKGTLFEAINNLEAMDNGAYIANLLQKLKGQSESALGFRHSAASTQAAQDRTRDRYIEFLKATLICPKDVSEDVAMEYAFPEDLKVLYMQVRMYVSTTHLYCTSNTDRFVIFAARSTRGRAIDAPRCSFQSLTKLRSGIMFHGMRSYELRNIPAPPRWILYNKITEALRFISKELHIPLYGDVNKSNVGLPELSQLIDFDMEQTRCIQLAECHHLAWCLGRICAVRPGSIGHGPQDKNNLINGQFLKWRDIEVFRNGRKGEFFVDVTFRVVKTNQADPEEGNNSRSPQRPIRCRVMPPKCTENLIFSVPHRLLVIALRRGAIEGIETLEELLTGNGISIMVVYSSHRIRVLK